MDSDQAIRQCFIEIRNGIVGEPNLFAFRLMAQTIKLYCKDCQGDKFITTPPKADDGLRIVEYIENEFMKGALHGVIVTFSEDRFFKRMKKTAHDLQVDNLIYGGVCNSLCAAFYTWYGCLSMAKLTRVMGSDKVFYTAEMRENGYAHLEKEWKEEERLGNPWIKFGVSLAKLLEEKRKKADHIKVIMDDWIPADSPYWENFKNK